MDWAQYPCKSSDIHYTCIYLPISIVLGYSVSWDCEYSFIRSVHLCHGPRSEPVTLGKHDQDTTNAGREELWDLSNVRSCCGDS